MPDAQWNNLGSADELKSRPLQQLSCGKTKIALIHVAGEVPEHPLCGGGRKGHQLDVNAQI